MKSCAGPTGSAFQQPIEVFHRDELGLAATFVAPEPDYTLVPDHHQPVRLNRDPCRSQLHCASRLLDLELPGMKIGGKLLRTGGPPRDSPSNALQIASGGSQKSLNRLLEILKKSQMATMSRQIKRLYEFGPFRLDPQKRVLWQGSEPVSLTPKAIETLIVLVENRDRVVSKDHLMKTLWPDSFVEESNLSQNIFVLRKALGDSTQEKRYILTVPGQGYQFTEIVREVGNQTEGEDALIVQSRSLSQVVVEKGVLDSKRVWTGVIVLVLISICAVAAWWTHHRPAPMRKLAQRRLTANSPDLPVISAAISPDGKYLGYSDQQGIHLQLLHSGEVQNVPWPAGTGAGHAFWNFGFWYPDSTRFAADLVVPGKPISTWSLSILGTQPQKLIEDIDGAFGISPDGSAIAFSRGRASSEIWLMGPNGETPHKILAASTEEEYLDDVVWAPTGKRIAYIHVRDRVDKGEYSIESCDLNGTNKTTILSDDKLRDFAWIAPDRLIYSRNLQDYSSDFEADNLSELKVDAESGVPRGQPHQFTDWSGFEVNNLSATSDGKHLGLIRSTHHGSVFVEDIKNGTQVQNPHRLTIDDHSNIPLAWTSDSHEVIFASRRTQALEIYRQRLDGTSPLQLVTAAPAMDFYNARVSPDGAWVIVQGKPQNSDNYGLYRVPIEGGAPQLLFPVEPETTDYRCLNQQTNLCAYGRFATDRKTYIIQAFDLTSGKGKELLRIPIEPGANYHWGLSPDGSQIGILREDWGVNQIRFVSLHGGPTRTIPVKGYANLQSFDWGPDLKSVIVGASGPGGSTLLRVGLDGSAQAIWQQPQPLRLWGIPSPDGNHITMFGTSADANVWMIENF
jgi:DNA-binding winged helix-turn-helix (wHTH) protein/Tol biopolymer transport system component